MDDTPPPSATRGGLTCSSPLQKSPLINEVIRRAETNRVLRLSHSSRLRLRAPRTIPDFITGRSGFRAVGSYFDSKLNLLLCNQHV